MAQSGLIAKGFTKPTDRIISIKNAIIDAMPVVETERAVLVTEAYKETEHMSPIMRRAKVLEKLLNNMHVTIRDNELIVGSLTKNIRSSEVGIEYSFEWLEEEFDTIGERANDPFIITEESKKILKEQVFPYWRGRTLSDYALSLMSPECKESFNYAVFNPTNYLYAGVAHSLVFYERILHTGYKGVLEDVVEAMEKLDKGDPRYSKKQEFYKALLITFTAAINHTHRYAQKAEEMAARENNPTRKAELLLIAQNCRHVPENGARNFYEACQSFWMVHHILRVETNGHSYSPGSFDRFMTYFYEKDKTITEEFAQELVDNVFLKFNDANKVRDDITAQAFAGYQMFEQIALSGQDEEGNDLTNPVSYLCLTAQAHTGMPSPSLTTRVSNKTPDEYMYRVAEVIRLGYGMPALFNDEVIIPAMVNRGIPLKVARTYAPSGCVEPDIPHKTEGWHDSASFNVAKVMSITLNNGRIGNKQLGPVTGELTSFRSIDDIMAAFKIQMKHFIDFMVEADNCIDHAHADRAPMPYQSGLIEDCIGKGMSTQEGGAIYNFTGPQALGCQDAGDSLYCIYKNVFVDKTITLEQLKEALDNNFGYPIGPGGTTPTSDKAIRGELSCGCAGDCTCDDDTAMEAKIYEAVRSILNGSGSVSISDVRNKLGNSGGGGGNTAKYADILRILTNTPGYGNDIDEVDQFTVDVCRIYCEIVETYTNPRGGQFQAGIYPVSANVLYGKDVGALPTGRLAKVPLADGVSPRAGVDVKGPTAAANSVAKLDHALASNGTLYNQKFIPTALAGDNGLKNFVALVRGYFERGGLHIQFNVIDRETLLDAQKHPERYKDLVVRVAGYSAHFTKLAKDVQDNLISRTEQTF